MLNAANVTYDGNNRVHVSADWN